MRILIAGLGGIGQRHLWNIVSVMGDSVQVCAVDPRQDIPVLTDKLQVEPNTTLEGKYNLEIYPDLGSGLSSKPDAVFVCNPTSLHMQTALVAVQAGCHIFIEKPLSHSLSTVDTVIEHTEKAGLVGVVGYQMRFHPCLTLLSSLLQEKKVGKILSVRAEIGEYLPGWHTYEDYRQMYASRKDLGGGVILSQIHEMDYLYWLFGFPQKIYALGGQLSKLEVDVEDTAEILMDMCDNDRHYPISLHADYVQRPPRRGCVVIGDSGKIILDFVTMSVTVYDESGNQVQSVSFADFQRNDMFIEEIKWFFQAVDGHPTPLVGLRAGMQSLRMALAARESLASGKVIELER